MIYLHLQIKIKYSENYNNIVITFILNPYSKILFKFIKKYI